MIDPVVARIQADPNYALLRRQRNRLGITLTILMLIVYYGFIGLIAFDKSFLAIRLGSGVTTIGIPIGLGVIVFTVLITGLYVWRANKTYDVLTAKILEAAK